MLAFLYWKAPQRPPAAPARPHQAITYILAPMKPPAVARAAPVTPRAAVTTPRRQPITPSAPQSITLPAPVAAETPPQAIAPSAPPDPFAQPVKPEQSVKERALLSAAAVDRQLRKEAWNPRDKKIANDETALAAAFSQAYKQGSGAIEEVAMPDGTRITRWRMPGGGVACFYKQGNNFSGGRDPFRDTGSIRVMSCP